MYNISYDKICKVRKTLGVYDLDTRKRIKRYGDGE